MEKKIEAKGERLTVHSSDSPNECCSVPAGCVNRQLFATKFTITKLKVKYISAVLPKIGQKWLRGEANSHYCLVQLHLKEFVGGLGPWRHVKYIVIRLNMLIEDKAEERKCRGRGTGLCNLLLNDPPLRRTTCCSNMTLFFRDYSF